MRRVLKFVLGPDVVAIATADEPQWLAVGWQASALVVWCLATPGEGFEARLVAVPTGMSPPDNAEYVGTAQHPTLMDGSPLVMHVFRRGGRS